MMKKVIDTAIFLMSLIMAAPLLADVSKTESKSYGLDKDASVSIENINGNILIVGWDRNEALLEYTKTAGDQENFDNIEVTVDSSSRRFAVEVDFKKQQSGWSFGRRGASGKVDFTLKVPHTVYLKSVESVNGRISIDSIKGDIRSATVNGRIRVDGAESDVNIETVNGDMDVSMNRLSADQKLKADSVNGDIEIYLPENDGFRLSSDTVNGDLSNDFGIKVEEGEYVGSDMDGNYKNGGARINIDTVNGDIEVRKGK